MQFNYGEWSLCDQIGWSDHRAHTKWDQSLKINIKNYESLVMIKQQAQVVRNAKLDDLGGLSHN